MFHDLVARADRIGVIACATREQVRRTVADQCIVQLVAGPVDGCGPNEGQSLEIRPQRPGHVAVHEIGPLSGLFHHRIARAHKVGIVAGSARQHIRCTVAREDVIQTVPRSVDSPSPREGQVLDIGAQRESHIAQHQIRPLIGGLHHRIACAHLIGVIARVPKHMIDCIRSREVVCIRSPLDSKSQAVDQFVIKEGEEATDKMVGLDRMHAVHIIRVEA